MPMNNFHVGKCDLGANQNPLKLLSVQAILFCNFQIWLLQEKRSILFPAWKALNGLKFLYSSVATVEKNKMLRLFLPSKEAHFQTSKANDRKCQQWHLSLEKMTRQRQIFLAALNTQGNDPGKWHWIIIKWIRLVDRSPWREYVSKFFFPIRNDLDGGGAGEVNSNFIAKLICYVLRCINDSVDKISAITCCCIGAQTQWQTQWRCHLLLNVMQCYEKQNWREVCSVVFEILRLNKKFPISW